MSVVSIISVRMMELCIDFIVDIYQKNQKGGIIFWIMIDAACET